MPKIKPKSKDAQIVHSTASDINIEEIREAAYMQGMAEAFVPTQTVERSYNSFNSAFGSAIASANSMLMNGAPTTMKDKNATSRFAEIQSARAMADANELMARYLQLSTARLIGANGPTLLTQLWYMEYKDGKAVKTIHELASRVVYMAWHEYCKAVNVDVAGWRGWDDYLNEDLGVGVPRDGSLIWVVHAFNPNKTDPLGPIPNGSDPVNPVTSAEEPLNGFGTSLQQLDTLYVARNLNTAYSPATKRRINNGVELDQYGRRVAVYFDFTNDFQNAIGTEVIKEYTTRVKTSDGYNLEFGRIPIFDERKWDNEGLSVVYYDNDPSPLPNQISGRGWAQVAITNLHSDKELSKYLMIAARAGASKALAVKKDASNNAPSPGNVVRAPNGQVAGVSIVPGQVTYLGEGQSIETIDFDLSYEGTLKFSRKLLQAVSAALAVPYAELTNDMDASSFATEHSADLRNNRLWGARREHARKSLLEPFVRFWFMRCVKYNVFKYGKPESAETLDHTLMKSMVNCLEFQFDAFEHQNPYDMERAADLRLKNGTSTLRDEILRHGGDPEDVISRRIEEIDRLKNAGVLVEGLTFFQGMDKLPEEFQLTEEQLAERARLNKPLEEAKAQQAEKDATMQTTLSEIKRSIDTGNNVQKMLLQELGSIDENISSGAAKTDFTPLVQLLAKKEETTPPTSIIRTFSATEREDGTFDLNTIKIYEENAVIVRAESKQETPVEPVAEEKVEPVEEEKTPEQKGLDALDSLLAEVKNLADN